MTVVLSIGTTHPWNIAGLGLDVLVGAELGVRVLSVCAAVSAQDAAGIASLETISPQIVREQLASVEATGIDAVRVGALTSVENVREIARALQRLRGVPAVVDPVMRATRGGSFADAATVAALRDEVAALPNVILTPNLAEASALLECGAIDRAAIGRAASELQRLGSRAVLLKGGHLDDDPVDALATRDGVELFGDSRIAGDLRGTGCILAMALACAVARGEPLSDAVRAARAFVRGKIASAREFGGLRVAY